MSETNNLALDLPGVNEHDRTREPDTLDLNAAHSFPFLAQRWFAGTGNAARGLLMVATGIFLFTQIASTPNLAIQMAILGALLSVGGLVFLVVSLRDFFGGVHVDQTAIRIRFGLLGYTIPWSNVATWRVNEASLATPALNSVELKLTTPDTERSIPGGYLRAADYYRLRRLLHAFAPGKEG